jgi:uncharacterized protein YcbK (DUF882 family)
MNRREKRYVIVNVDTGEVQRVLGSFSLSENFEVWEFVSTDKSETVLYSQRLVNILQAMRDFYKRPVDIISGHREIELNEEHDGYVDSEHLYGYAVDIKIQGVTMLELWHKCILFAGYISNVGMYKTHVHLGIQGYHRRARQ